MGGPSSIAGKSGCSGRHHESIHQVWFDTSMHRRDMASLPVWRVGAEFDWLLRANGSKIIKNNLITFVRLGLKILCVKSRGNQTIWVTCNAFWRFLIKFKMAENPIRRKWRYWVHPGIPTVPHLWNLDQSPKLYSWMHFKLWTFASVAARPPMTLL